MCQISTSILRIKVLKVTFIYIYIFNFSLPTSYIHGCWFKIINDNTFFLFFFFIIKNVHNIELERRSNMFSSFGLSYVQYQLCYIIFFVCWIVIKHIFSIQITGLCKIQIAYIKNVIILHIMTHSTITY